MESPKSLILKVRLRPDAKKPPKGAIKDAKVPKTRIWTCIGAIEKDFANGNQIGRS